MTDKEFFKQISSIPLLTEEEEKSADYDTLVYHNLRLVLSLARQYSASTDAELGDLFQNGCIGLCASAQQYDGSVRFSTYAYNWIKKYVLQYLNLDYGVHIPLNTTEFAATVRSTRSRLLTALEREPTEEEIAADLGCVVNKVRDALTATQAMSSLDAPIGDEEDATFGDTLANHSQGYSNPYNGVEYDDDCETIRKVVATLPKREAEIIKMRFGIDCAPLTLEETGKKLGLGKERTRQLENSAIRKLRHPTRTKMLIGCLC